MSWPRGSLNVLQKTNLRELSELFKNIRLLSFTTTDIIENMTREEMSEKMRRMVNARYAKKHPIKTSRLAKMTPAERSAEMRRVVNVRWNRKKAVA
jgi:hypothetical protein